jgi:polyisoprenoid-binding protein YceI
MMLRAGLVATAIACSALAIAAAPRASLPAAHAGAPGSYSIDPVHSSVLFRIKHLGASYFYGRFNEVHGTITFDEANPASSSIDVEVKIESVDTHAAKRDADLKGADFFNAATFPTATFKSKSWSKSGDAYEVTGDLTIHGVTKPVTAKFEKTGTGKSQRGGSLIGFETVFNVKRSDFGVSYMPDGLGEDVRIIIALEAGGAK